MRGEVPSTQQGLVAAFEGEYGKTPRVFSAPGRVNLIGEHTDYNDGFVLPIAIDRRTRVAAARREDRRLRVVARDFDERAEFDLDGARTSAPGGWLSYVEGVARVLDVGSCRLPGADLMIESDVPIGAGLSSSAALEVAVGFALACVAEQELPLIELALAAQAAEHRYAGTRCGIMDQYIAALGRSDHALLIDCRSLEATAVPASFSDSVLLVCDSRVKHSLATSAYNQRRAECEEGVRVLAEQGHEVRALRDVSLQELHVAATSMSPVTARRCRHVVSENTRTLSAVEALHAQDMAALGRLMTQSHQSLARDYEVSCAELDWLVSAASHHPGVWGARLTGAGFGGCTISLVQRWAAESLETTLIQTAQSHFDTHPPIFTTQAASGVGEEK